MIVTRILLPLTLLALCGCSPMTPMSAKEQAIYDCQYDIIATPTRDESLGDRESNVRRCERNPRVAEVLAP